MISGSLSTVGGGVGCVDDKTIEYTDRINAQKAELQRINEKLGNKDVPGWKREGLIKRKSVLQRILGIK